MNRIHEKYLAKWILKRNRKPLIIRGARQVGKSTLVRNFCFKEKYDLFEINLERHYNLKRFFKEFSLKEFLREVELICGKEGVLRKKSILFLDEIQAIPEAIAALRYFYEDYPDLILLTAGSLLEFTLSKHSFSMPVGRVEYLFMGPMTFEEFLEAKEEKMLLNYIRSYNFNGNFSPTAHATLMEIQRDYFLVGGMPEAVQLYIDDEEFNNISSVHTSIIETYIDDFAKYAKGETLHTLQKVFNYVGITPGQKIKYANIDSNMQAREIKKSIVLLEKARVIFPVYHSSASGIPLSNGKNDKIYKSFFLDIGLMNKIAKVPDLSIAEMRNINFINKGVMSEQFIYQHLLEILPKNETPSLFYWLREGKKNNAELDFVMQFKSRILPIEVKAGLKGSLKSLHRFVFEKGSDIAVRFDMNPPIIQKVKTSIVNSEDNSRISYNLISLPLYMVNQLERILELSD